MRSAAALLALTIATPALCEPVAPRFTDETASAGIEHVFEGGWEYMVGGGAAVFDCDGDAFPDMLLAGGSAPARFYRNAGEPGGPLAFEAMDSGLELDAVAGAYPLDIDGDGHVDIVLLRVGENVVMRGLGGCRFERANEAWGFDGGDAWSTSLAATWEKGADWPTIAIGNYVDRNEQMFPWGSCTDNWLHRPGEDAAFAPPLPLTPSFCTLSMLFTDWDRSGRQDLRVSNDREYYKGGEEQLWHVPAGQAPSLYTAAEGWQRLRIWGMGIAAHDLDGNGYPEYFLTSMADNKLQALSAVPVDGEVAKPVYTDIALARGVTAHRPHAGDEVKPSTAWHAEFQDVNNDGLADLFVAKGNVWEMPDFALADPNNLLVQRPDGTFAEMSETASVASMLTSRGAALADFNLDGLVDLVVVNRHGPAELWRNTTEGAGQALQLNVTQDHANRNGIGGWIEVRTGDRVQRREMTVGGGHAGGQLGWWHFGLGASPSAEVRILWPDGEEGPWQAVEPGFWRIERGAEPAAWRP
jgi:hypothetical protein